MNTQTAKKGFTIIEVVLVLAIAALIFLMIFVALPALQKGQRDTARKQDANTVASALGTYRSNHSGKMPTAIDQDFIDKYVKNLAQIDPSTSGVVEGSAPEDDDFDTITVELGYTCSKEGGDIQGDESTRGAAVRVRLESSTDVVCTDA